MAKDNNLTDMQLKFLDALFDEAKGDIKVAWKLAGYAGQCNMQTILGVHLKDAIIDRAKTILALGAPKAVLGLIGLVDEPTEVGAKVKLAAAMQVLDRVNIVKTDHVQIEGTGGLFILPAKEIKEEDNGVSVSP